ncbi:hypothetical protein BASA81_015571 [Batrachochytrium salamandrivorans]|nr:hypothetical protein BASA81_015571 [Batrachochytrium salamandrivorans]
MKLVSFAVVSFLAATVSAGFSETLGNADYSVHQLEKRDPGEDMQKQLEEEIKQDWEHYKEALGTYQDMKNLEVELEAEVSEARFESEIGGYTPEGEGSRSQQHDAAILSYKRQYKDTFDQYVVMMIAKEKLYKKLLSTSIAHLVVECEQVAGHRIQSGLVPAIQKSRLRLLGRALDPGVENVYTWLRGGVLNGEADLDQRWLDGTVEHESMGTRHDNRALAARLADFLQVAYRQYQSTL